MIEQKIAPVLSDDDVIDALRPIYDDAVTEEKILELNLRLARAIEQAVLARAGAAAVHSGTPAAAWRVAGEPDPHAGHYDGERAQLALGYLTDDELANGAFMNYDRQLDIAAVLNKTSGYHPPIAWMTAVKERIRWLSRKLVSADEEIRALKGTPAAAVADTQPIDWPSVEKVIAEYLDDYEMVGEDAAGREGYYTPTDTERALIKDAVHGLLAEDELMRHLRAATQLSSNPGPLAGPRPIMVTRTSENTVMLAFSSGERADLYERAAIAASKENSNG